MSRINSIQKAIQSLDGGEYQKFMDAYLCKKFKYKKNRGDGSAESKVADMTQQNRPKPLKKSYKQERYPSLRYN